MSARAAHWTCSISAAAASSRHPGGRWRGRKAVQQAWEAAVAGIPLEIYAKDHPELAQSIAAFVGDGKGA